MEFEQNLKKLEEGRLFYNGKVPDISDVMIIY